ncbi:trafficking protein particle complex subunit 11-like [Watersipora subatra]|uniref:trafficking protein particle complex subunit 11-like n=1 Tax=Watersipora subatra TaxID=2589382 RepID=UPI00355BCA6A
MMAWACDFPNELLQKPLGLAVLAGLETTYNAVHKGIWDLFCNNRKSDRVPLNFVTLPVDHDYPKAKAKRANYEWYIPKGILPRNWMIKHLSKVPALIITFFDLDWDEPHWNEKLIECSSRLKIIRNSLEKRSTKVVAVLIQRSPPLPPGEDNMASERAAAFCTECDLSPKSLFVLPHTDHLLGYIIRLENAFYELAQNYFTTSIRRVQAHRDYLNRTTHQMLFIRHQFKVAFFNELKQDRQIALKRYKQAYGYCLEAKANEHTILEVKTVAGFVSYKICLLSFMHNAPLDAIEQFRKHIENFKTRVGPPHLAFEHSAWLSKQFQHFGDLFDESIRRGLTAIQTQHPGFYYYQAAQHAITRKQLCIGLCQGHETTAQQPEPVDFFGQRPWLTAYANSEVSDSTAYQQALSSLQNLELMANHSGEIIQLLTVAINHFQKHKSSRMRVHLMVMIGEEHYHAREYHKALQILNRVATEYRKEGWYTLLTAVVTTALRSAYLLADLQNYITLSLEFLAEEICRSVESKTKAQVDLLQVICGNIPDHQPGCDVGAVAAATQRWQDTVSASPVVSEPICVNMADILSFVDCKVCFMKSKYKVDEEVKLVVYVRCNAQFSLRFSQLELVFNNEEYNQKCVLKDAGDLMAVIDESQLSCNDLLFLSRETKAFDFSLNPETHDMGKTLQAMFVNLSFDSAVPIVLRCPLSQGNIGCDAERDRAISAVQQIDRLPEWSAIPSRTSIELACRNSELQVEANCETTCLLNECFPINWMITNGESESITNVRLAFSVEENSSGVYLSLNSKDVTQLTSGNNSVVIEKMDHTQQVKQTLFVRAVEEAPVRITAKVLYNIQDDTFSQSCVLNLDVVNPFTITFHYLNKGHINVNADEPFLLHFTISNATQYSLHIQNAQLHLSEHVPEENQLVSQISDLTLHGDEEATEYQSLVMPSSMNNDIIPGEYQITWRRADASDETLVHTMVGLPPVTVEQQPLYVDCEMPAYGHVNRPLNVVYTLHNRTGYVQEFEASMDSCDSFAFTGHKQLHFRTLPYGSHSIAFTMYPLATGQLPLPIFKLNMMKQANVTDFISKLLPKTIYVLPLEY